MRASTTWGVSLLATCASAWKTSPAVAVKKHIAENEYTLIAFVATETEATKALLPEWEAVGQDAPAQAVNCTQTVDLCKEMGVVSFPTIRLYARDGALVRYRGARKATSILSFSKRVSQPTVTSLRGDAISAFSTTDEVVFIAHLQDKENDALTSYSKIADEYHDRYSFGITSTKKQSQIQCYNNIEGSQQITVDLNRVGALEELVEKCIEPAIPLLTRRNEMKYMATGKSLVYYFSHDAADREAYSKSMRPIAEAYQEYLKLVTVDSGEYPDMASSLGVRQGKGLSVRNLHNGQVFPYQGDGEVSTEQVGAFIVAISQGQVQPWDGTTASTSESSDTHDEL